MRYGPGLADAFIDLADGLEDAFPGLDVEGEETEVVGAFEVVAPGGQVVWGGGKGCRRSPRCGRR